MPPSSSPAGPPAGSQWFGGLAARLRLAVHTLPRPDPHEHARLVIHLLRWIALGSVILRRSAPPSGDSPVVDDTFEAASETMIAEIM